METTVTAQQEAILVVDDAPGLRSLLAEMLRDQGYPVLTAESGVQALETAANAPLQLILLDINMPGMDGYQVCRYLKEDPRCAGVPVMFISGMEGAFNKIEAFGAGAVDYITKPFQAGEVIARVKTHLRVRNLQRRLQHTNDQLEGRIAQRTIELERQLEKTQRLLDSTVFTMAKMVELRDPYTAGHQQRVAQLAQAIALTLELPPDQVTGTHMTAMIHDCGKISLPAELLSKPGRLLPLEMDLIQTHPQIGAQIVSAIEFPWPVAETILQHHERLDGSGYPHGLSGDQITLEARVLAVADVVEAMSSHRPYRPACGLEQALDEIGLGAGRLYDLDVATVCIRLFTEDGFTFGDPTATPAHLTPPIPAK